MMESMKKQLLASGNWNISGEMQSVFFVKEQVSFLQQVQSCYEGIVEYMDAWKKFDGAGTHLLDSLQNVVKETIFEVVGSETSNAFKSVYVSSNGIDPEGKLKEMENLMVGLKTHLENSEKNEKCRPEGGEKIDKGQGHIQVLCRCLLLFLKLKYDYYQMCSTTITSLLKKLVQSGETSDNKDLLQQMDSLDLLTSSPRDSPNRSLSRKKNAGSSSPKTKNKHNTFTSSFLSLFERKNSPDEKSSAFYVDLNQPASIQSESDGSSHMSADNQSDILVQIGLDPVQEEKSEDHRVFSLMTPQIIGPTGPTSNGHLATEEELDSVINLLSGIGGPSGHMEPIPENQAQLNIPSVYSSRTPSPREMDEQNPSKLQSHRRSEGSLDLTGIGNMGRNTWPHRSSLPTSHLQNFHDPANYSNTVPRRYSHDLNVHYRSSSQNLLSPTSSSHMMGFPWGFQDCKGSNRTWPASNISSGSDTLNSSWSAMHDTDDMSDDSSCGGGEQFFAVGLDLVHALDSKDGSSDEDGGKSPGYERPKSTDGHLNDKQSTNTWPPKQLWSQSNMIGGDLSQEKPVNQSHRPVSMQWSDPLANRNVWSSSGIGNSHSMHGFGPVQ